MSTRGDLVNTIHAALHSYTGLQEQVSWLTSAVSDTDTVFPVASTDAAIKGTAEIDNELVYVNNTDSSGLTLAPFGRGFKGSVAAAHSLNAMVVFDPAFPKVEIHKAINQCIEGLYPSLYQIKTFDIDPYTQSQIGYDLPTDCDKVLEVKWKYPGAMNAWLPVSRWSFDSNSPEVNGNSINIYEDILPGTIRVVYMAKFGTFAADSDTFASVGLSESMADLVLYGVTSRMVRFLDPARLQATGVENLSRAGVVASGDAGKIANQLYAMYQQRLNEERTRLLTLTPAQINFTR